MVQHDSGALWPKFLLGHGRLPLGLFAPSTDPDSNYANSMAVSSLGGKCALPLDNAAINQIIGLSIVPSVILLVLAFVRYCRLFNQPVKVQPGFIFFVKLAFYLALACSQAAGLLAWLGRSVSQICPDVTVGIPATGLGVAASLTMALLSPAEDRKSVKTSNILTLYLGSSAIFDLILCRTIWFPQDPDSQMDKSLALPLLLCSIFKTMLFFLEMQSKTRRFLLEWAKTGPEEASGIINRSLFWWINSLIIRGYKNKESMTRYYKLDSELLARNGFPHLYLRWRQQIMKTKSRPLVRAVLSYSLPSMLRCVVPRLLLMTFRLSQPFLIKNAIKYTQQDHHNGADRSGYNLIAQAVGVYVGLAISDAIFERAVYRQSTLIRGAVSSLVLHDATDIATEKDGESAVTLVTSDVNQILFGFETFHNIWSGLVELSICMYLLWRQVGFGSIGPILMTIVSSLLATLISVKMPAQQMAWSKAIETRVKQTTAIISSMKEVKLLGSVNLWYRKIEDLMKNELSQSRAMRASMTLMNGCGNLSHVFSPVFAFGIALLISAFGENGRFTYEYAFTTISIFSLVGQPTSAVLWGMPAVLRSLAAFERIEKYLLLAEEARVLRGESSEPAEMSGYSDASDATTLDTDIAIDVQDATFSFAANDSFSLKNVNLTLKTGTFTMVIGKVGTGKTVLLNSLLGEIKTTGKVLRNIGSGIAYCPQSAWLFNGTIRKNIVGESVSTMDQDWYNTVVKACALDIDFLELRSGDQTEVGSKGVTLSGGQRHRVNLARALYSRHDFLAIDDVLSGLDWTTQAHVWSQVFGPNGLLRKHNRTVILATHHTSHLEDADKIVLLGQNGQISQQGTFGELSSTEDFSAVLKTRQPKSHSGSSSDDERDDKPTGDAKADSNVAAEADSGAGDWSLYGYFLQHIGMRNAIILFCLGLLMPLSYALGEFWIMIWAAANEQNPQLAQLFYYLVYTVIQLIAFFGMLADLWFILVVLMPKTAEAMHHILLNTMMKAPLSFFTNTASGDIVNRFSKDLKLITESLTTSFLFVWFTLRLLVTSCILVLPGSSYLALSVPVTVGFVYYLAKIYLPNSRRLRKEDIQEAAPINTHLLETIDGLVTIRAFGWREYYRETALELVDKAQTPHYLLLCAQRWLNLVLDLYTAAIAVSLIALAVFLPDGTQTGLMSVALVNVLSLSSALTTLVSMWTQLETSLGAIARVKEFEIETAQEKEPEVPQELASMWPANGKVVINGATASYSKDSLSPAVNDVTVTIEAGKRVAICGRTGSGKSSLLLTLFRLMDLDSGSIAIDGLDTTTISPNTLRERLICVPQDPTLFPGSLRSNLWQSADETVAAPSDEEMQKALEGVGLWETVSSQGGLDKEASELSFSHGQKQLACLCRAVLRKDTGNILALDEAMSAVDGETEKVMVEVLDREFANHTIISVAHRLNTVRHYDQIVVLEKGKVVETGEPDALLEKEDGRFRALWNARG